MEKEIPTTLIKANLLKTSLEVDLEDKDGRKLAGEDCFQPGKKLSEQIPPTSSS